MENNTIGSRLKEYSNKRREEMDAQLKPLRDAIIENNKRLRTAKDAREAAAAEQRERERVEAERAEADRIASLLARNGYLIQKI